MRKLIFVTALLVAACSGPADDPFEPLNRSVHGFNKATDRLISRDSDDANDAPELSAEENGAVTLARNVSGNLSLPGKVVNHLLQGRPSDATQNAQRFVVNSTLGLGGLMDPAGAEFGLAEIDTDFGETLYRWGAPEGPYLELPLLGPTTTRRAVGRVVDWAIDPIQLEDEAAFARLAMTVISKAGDRAAFGGTIDGILYGSADSYAQTRLLYLQHRRYLLGQEADEIDPYED